MKKFLIFLVSIVVVVCVGLTTYYFMRNNEIITIKTKEIYCNAGDTIPLASLGIKVEKANISKKTKFNYNAGGDDVTKYIKYDEATGSFIVSQSYGGDVTLVISTTNKKYADFTISVHIGDGSEQNPYYIFNENELKRIGSTYRLDQHYTLMSDITLSNDFESIGYNSNTSTWDGFDGSFNGQNHTISNLKLDNVQTKNVGLFSSLGANANVKDLTISNSTINGSYENVGVLAGTINGNVEKVAIKNAQINNNLDNANIGSLAGEFGNSSLKMSYAENVNINVETQNDANVGGLVGKFNETTVQACYTNNVAIDTLNAIASVGGFAGEFVIGTNSGSIQQSYANATGTDSQFAGFIGEISKNATFEEDKANMLRHLIGNIAVVYGSTSIADTDLVRNYDSSFFKNATFANRSAFFDKDSALYLIRGFAGANEVISTNEFVFYAIDASSITSWDTDYVWNTSNNNLPTLRMTSVNPSSPSGEYFRRDLTLKPLTNKQAFIDLLSAGVKDDSIKLLEDIDISNGWTPATIENSTFDGNNKTITINLNNATNNNAGLFATINNSTIKNLNIVVVGVSANSTNAGALAGEIFSTDKLTNSTIENVNIVYQNYENPTIQNFGGVAGTIQNTVIKNCSVSGLNISENASISNAGAIVAVVKSNSQIANSSRNFGYAIFEMSVSP